MTARASARSSGELLLSGGAGNVGHEEVVKRIVRRLEDDLPYHAELFDDTTSRLIRQRILEMGMPCDVEALGASLLSNCAALHALAAAELKAMVASCAGIKLKAMRAAAASKAEASLAKLRAVHEPLRARGVTIADDDGQLLAELATKIAPLLPTQAAESDDDDDDYY